MMYEIINKKRYGHELSKEEIEYFVEGCTKGDIPDYQASALLMAICINGMSFRETVDLTLAIEHSGEEVDLSDFGDESVDKHSAGGVGDKVTLIVAPIVACLGAKVVKMSGRGLGHTGGTIDKLESIEGFRVELEPEEFRKQVKEIGVAVIGQSGNLTPADKKLYALRDVTATVRSIPLIASSIMGKKLASGAKNIVLDITCGKGAFMKNPAEAKELAEKMVEIGKQLGRNVIAVITDMNQPRGYCIGNALEVKEAIDVLKGNGSEDLSHVCLVISARLLEESLGISYEDALRRVAGSIDNGSAFRKFKEWISAQGGNAEWIDNTELFPKAKYEIAVRADENGYICEIDAEKIGRLSVKLGAGREKKGDAIDYSAGIIMKKKIGDYIQKDEIIALLYTNIEEAEAEAVKLYKDAIMVGSDEPQKCRAIIDTIK